jgi:hypothetical protein
MNKGKPKRKWSDEFSRSSLGQNVFYCRTWNINFVAQFKEVGIPIYDPVGTMFGNEKLDAVFLDGGFIGRYPYGFLGLRGQWIIGYGALRYICATNDLTQPRKLKEEKYVPTVEELKARLKEQLENERDILEARFALLRTGGVGSEVQLLAKKLHDENFWNKA